MASRCILFWQFFSKMLLRNSSPKCCCAKNLQLLNILECAEVASLVEHRTENVVELDDE